MKCHYEVLNVERDADEAQIKTAYRKAALKCHPDKNLDDPDGAKEMFQLVQQAYEVLSDPQERAWYDKHREQILKGSGSNYEDNALCVFQYFTASCYSGFGDDEKGFYTVFRNVFDQLASEEIEHLDSPEEFEAIPKFGNSTSDYDEIVQPFYAYWQSFCTKKSYAWLSTHNINDIRDRRILKVVEKENKKVQQKARKERNEEIRGLVSFVRKRDRRVQARRKLLEERAVENRRRQAQLDLELALKRKQEVAEQMKNQPCGLDDGYEEQLRQLEKAMQSSEEEEGDGDDDLDPAEMEDLLVENLDGLHMNGGALDCELYCVACNKTFKNQSSFRNHELSKKHKENVELIREEMMDDDDIDLQSADAKDNVVNDKDESCAAELEMSNVVEEQPSNSKSKKKKLKGKSLPVLRSDVLASDYEDEAQNEFLTQEVKKSDSDDDDWGASKQKGRGGRARAKPGVGKKDKVKKDAAPVKEEKREAKDKNDRDATEPLDVDHQCVTCLENFSSKNRLFTHLKKTNHGVYLPKGKVITQGDAGDLRKGKTSGGANKRK